MSINTSSPYVATASGWKCREHGAAGWRSGCGAWSPRSDGAARTALKIMLVGPVHPWRGGIAQHGSLLAAALAEKGHDVEVLGYRSLYPRWLYPGADPREPSGGVTLPRDIPVHSLLRPLGPITWVAGLRAIRRAAPDVVLIQWWVPFFAPLLAFLGRGMRGRSRRVFICHNVLPHEGGGILDRLLTRFALRSADAWLVHASSDRKRLQMLLGGAPASALRCVALPAFALRAGATESEEMGGDVEAMGDSRAQARARLDLDSDALVALFFGFVRPYKGLKTLIDALPASRSGAPRLQLVVAGEFWEDIATYQKHALGLGVADAVRLDAGYVPSERAVDYFAAADMVVLPYHDATQSGVAPIAMAAFIPVIASAVGGLPDLIRHRHNGLLVPARDAVALARAIVELGTSPALRDHIRANLVAESADRGWGGVVAALEALAGDRAGAEARSAVERS